MTSRPGTAVSGNVYMAGLPSFIERTCLGAAFAVAGEQFYRATALTHQTLSIQYIKSLLPNLPNLPHFPIGANAQTLESATQVACDAANSGQDAPIKEAVAKTVVAVSGSWKDWTPSMPNIPSLPDWFTLPTISTTRESASELASWVGSQIAAPFHWGYSHLPAMPEGFDIRSISWVRESASESAFWIGSKIAVPFHWDYSNLPQIPEFANSSLDRIKDLGSRTWTPISSALVENIGWAGPVAGIYVTSRLANRFLEENVENPFARYTLSRAMGVVTVWGLSQALNMAFGTSSIGLETAADYALRTIVTEIGLKAIVAPFAQIGVNLAQRIITNMQAPLNSEANAKIKRS